MGSLEGGHLESRSGALLNPRFAEKGARCLWPGDLQQTWGSFAHFRWNSSPPVFLERLVYIQMHGMKPDSRAHGPICVLASLRGTQDGHEAFNGDLELHD